MHLLVAEKNISARRIAGILAGKEKVHETRDGGISSYSFGQTVLVGLKGHVVEVDFEAGYSNWRSEERTPRSLIDARTIKVPTEKKIVSLLQKLAKKADRVTIATDFDTEGELIGKEAYELVRAVNPTVRVDRARFSAITPEEIRHAFSQPTEIDFALASAGEARQAIDLMWGASLTRFLSLAARRGGNNILSVGRVQSPTLAMIVDREKEIEAFCPENYWQLHLTTEKTGEIVEARHTTSRFTDKAEAEGARDRTNDPLVVTEVKEGEKIDRAPSPFDTTTFIVAAARLGYSAANAMRLAEDLYMNGFISYPRTDNTVYPPTLDLAGVLAAIRPTVFRADVEWVAANRRSKPTQGKKTSTDHPPIHPTSAARREDLGEDRWKIYELVVRRFLVTLSPDARWLTLKVNFAAGVEPYTAIGGRLIEPGWRKVYPFSAATEHILPRMTVGERLPIREIVLQEKETQPPARFTQSKLIQRMEELGLGTKSTRHEVIAKLVSRKYVEGNPLRPTLVGRAVIDSLENHADAITRPDMTQTLESHMQQIKEKKRTREDVVTESRGMLHSVFDELEQHGEQIGGEIMDQTAEELTLGPCPVCGHDIRIRHLRNQTQFIGCTHYPECGFNIGLPMTMWGWAVRTDDVCEKHRLHSVRLVKKGARPWDLGCPLCHHIASNREALALLPSMTDALHEKMIKAHFYTVVDLAGTDPSRLTELLQITPAEAQKIHDESQCALDILRRRSDCRKFVRGLLTPRRGRSPGAVIKKLHAAGIDDIEGLGKAQPAVLKQAGIGDKEVSEIQAEAKRVVDERTLKAMGIPAVSLKKYRDAGITSPDDFLRDSPLSLANRAGVSPETASRHAELVAKALKRPVPEKVTKAQVAKGKAELLSINGIDETLAERLSAAGVYNVKMLMELDPNTIAARSGIPESKIRMFRDAAPRKRKKRADEDIIII